MQLAEIGKTDQGGITRFSFSEEETRAKTLVKQYMNEANLEVYEDAIGNLFGKKSGEQEEAPTVLIGSHLDTVYNGGAFDGALGVLAAIEVLQAMEEQGVSLTHPVEAVVFTDEEGARFNMGMLGSRAFTGALTAECIDKTDANNISVKEAMLATGYDPSKIDQLRRPGEQLKAYLELHIEQGQVLEEKDSPVGIVTGIAGPLWKKYTLTGETGHAGATPMLARKDALACAAVIIQAVENAACSIKETVATVGRLSVEPGGINIIPGKTEFTLDLRNTSPGRRDQVEDRIAEAVNETCRARKIAWEEATLQKIPPVECDQNLQELIRESLKELGIKEVWLATGAAHDANQISRLCPVSLIFVRSYRGISHAPEEYSSKKDCAEGTRVLYRAVYKVAGGKTGRDQITCFPNN